MNGIDISHYQGEAGFKISNHLDQIDFCICKATEGLDYVDPYCDVFVQTLRAAGKPWGFYHFGRNNDPISEADFFHRSCMNYFGEGLPVLDWEADQSVEWVNSFVRRIHDLTGVWPWVYANPWRFQQGGVEPNCGRWVAKYPNVLHPPLDYKLPEVPDADGLVACWQFCSDGRLDGYSGNLDFNRFYGDKNGWKAYCTAMPQLENETVTTVLENDEYKITVERK